MELTGLLDKLKLDYLAAQLETVCEQAARQELDYQSFLGQALQVEWQGRSQRGIEARLRQARFPWLKTLEQFEPSLDRRQLRELAGLGFVERGHNVVRASGKPIYRSPWASRRSKPAIRLCS